MTLFGTKWVWRTGLAAAGLFAGVAVQAQVAIAADEIVGPAYEEEIYADPPPAVVYREEESYPVPVRRPPPVEVAVLAPREVLAGVRERGYEPTGALRRRGWVYSVSVLDPNGEDGRAVVDARTGRVMRFVPAYAMSPRMSDEIGVRYGRFGQPIEDLRYAPRPPAGVPHGAWRGARPHLASRTPSAVPLPRPRHAAKPAATKAADKPPVDQATPDKAIAGKPAIDRTAPETTAAGSAAVTKPAGTAPTQTSAAVESKTVGAAQASVKPADVKSAVSRPAAVELKPTQDMPPVQPLN